MPNRDFLVDQPWTFWTKPLNRVCPC